MTFLKVAVASLLCFFGLLLPLLKICVKAALNDQILDGVGWILWYIFRATSNPRVVSAIAYVASCNAWTKTFVFLFLFRYIRLLVNITAYWAYQPTLIPKHPTLTSKDVSVIVPTIDPMNPAFEECIASLAANDPKHIIVVAAGGHKVYDNACRYESRYPCVSVITGLKANKRVQICQGLDHINTKITILCDDHVFWPVSFFPRVLAAFENRFVGAVGTNKRARRVSAGFSFASFWNFLGVLYLERHNFEIAATNHLEGGVFCVSGRTAAYRTAILKDRNFINGFLNEYTFFGFFGPLNADDDNFITRWCVNHGWRIKIQSTNDSMIETTLGTYPRFLSQCLRWARTTWRSNSTSLFVDRTVWRTQPWCVYAIYLTSFFNFALFQDIALLWTLYFAMSEAATDRDRTTASMVALGIWIFCSKLVKPFPHFWRNPEDLVFLPGYILFGYYHSLIKLWALLTFWDTAWNGRPNFHLKTDQPSPSHL